MIQAALSTTIGKLLTIYDEESFIKMCREYTKQECDLKVEELQEKAWEDCFLFLKQNLAARTDLYQFPIIFEFMMPETLKRLDVVILTQNKVLALEFKKSIIAKESYIAQAAGYARSISYYHFETAKNNMEVIPYLVFTPGMPSGRASKVTYLYSDNFVDEIMKMIAGTNAPDEKYTNQWVTSPYHPLKNVSEATLQLFKEGDLPNIKTVKEGDIKDSLTAINKIIDNPALNKSIIFIAGVPGAGKTLVGLKTVYDYANPESIVNPVFLSGNDPFVNILQDTLSENGLRREGTCYISSMINFKRKYGYDSDTPNNNIIVFDEAQRAWSMGKKRGETEAKLLLDIGDKVAKKLGKVTIICLIGEGQFIHKGEEKGMSLWTEALSEKNDWNVYVPKKYEEIFREVPYMKPDNRLFLDTSIRNDFIDVSPWVEAILEADLAKARECYKNIVDQGFHLYRFRKRENLKKIVDYVKQKYPESHTGIILSSHIDDNMILDNNITYGTRIFGEQYRGSFVKADEAYDWFINKSSELQYAASEFLIQGIELE